MAKRVNLEVKVRHGDNLDRAIKRFMRKLKKEKIVEEYIAKQRYEKPSAIKHRKKRLAEKKRKQELEAEKEKEKTIYTSGGKPPNKNKR